MHNNKDLLKFYYEEYEEINNELYLFENDDTEIKFKIFEVENDTEIFFDDFIITEEIIKNGFSYYQGFTCIFNLKDKYYIYEIGESYEVWISEIEISRSKTNEFYKYNLIENDDKNYELLNLKKEILLKIIFDNPKYRLKRLFNKKKINYIKL